MSEKPRGPMVEHWFSAPIQDATLTGAKVMDPKVQSPSVYVMPMHQNTIRVPPSVLPPMTQVRS